MRIAEQLGLLTRTSERRLRRRVAEVSSRPFQQLRALRVIKYEKIETQAALADRLLIDAPAASRLVRRLVADGLLERFPGADRRCVRLRITRAARREVAVLDAGVDWLEAELRRQLSAAEARALIGTLTALNATFSSGER